MGRSRDEREKNGLFILSALAQPFAQWLEQYAGLLKKLIAL